MSLLLLLKAGVVQKSSSDSATSVEMETRVRSARALLELWEAGVFRRSLGAYDVLAEGVITAQFAASDLLTITGADCELRVISQYADARLDVGAIAWDTQYQAAGAQFFTSSDSGSGLDQHMLNVAVSSAETGASTENASVFIVGGVVDVRSDDTGTSVENAVAYQLIVSSDAGRAASEYSAVTRPASGLRGQGNTALVQPKVTFDL